ncbi:replicative DNA helicase [Tumebacillus permanentifrigoris]|uniref:Replicative DNA helicase n=1 Tax=Tumebacillus permanentifrigoris TaxID=378543 RepID=A0A316DAL0_9BACL|nr:replicative DNA helicase [Tumebacillus permanentifrigoris]PWK10192.1 primary replicative DNA helicase [Tumebacillus permanentifrigoris]
MSEQHEVTSKQELPHHLESEQATLGAILIELQVSGDVIEILPTADMFHEPKHRTIYGSMLEMIDAGDPVDIVTLSKHLADAGKIESIGGVAYLAQLSNSVPTAANVDFYANTVFEKWRARELIAAQRESAAALQSGEDIEEVMIEVERRTQKAREGRQKGAMTPIKDILMSEFDRSEFAFNQAQSNVPSGGISTGYPDADKMLAGLRRSDLIILAARPAVGKTAFALNLATNVAVREDGTVGIFSLEMAKEQLVGRMICAEGNIDAGRYRTGMFIEDDWPKMTMAVGAMSEAKIFIDDTPGITVQEIRTKCQKLKEKHGLDVVLIDYLQLIAGPRGRRSDNRQQEVAEISRTLKLIARELDITVIALSQLSRSVEQRQDKRPMLSDLRESGSIEQDADIVSFLYRDDYYNPETERKNIVEFIIGKQRGGATGTVELIYIKNFNKFVSLERAPGA